MRGITIMCDGRTQEDGYGHGAMLQQEPGLVSEAKTKTYNIHAQEHNDIRRD